MFEATTYECKSCGYAWFPRKAHPVVCPSCKSNEWAGPKEHKDREKWSKTCLRCGNVWASRKEEPVACTTCQSRQWNMPRPDPIFQTCLRCGHVWSSRNATPKECPTCKSQWWNTPRRKTFSQACLRCGHMWFSRRENPKECPACKSLRWNTPIREKIMFTIELLSGTQEKPVWQYAFRKIGTAKSLKNDYLLAYQIVRSYSKIRCVTTADGTVVPFAEAYERLGGDYGSLEENLRETPETP